MPMSSIVRSEVEQMDNEINVRSTRARARKREKISNASVHSFSHTLSIELTLSSCIACRNSKTRCSGRHPCERCIRRKETCVFEEKEKKVAVSVEYVIVPDRLNLPKTDGLSYLDQLHARIESLEAQSRSVQGLNSTTEVLSSGSVQLNARYPSRNPPQSPLGETRTPSVCITS